MKFTSNQRVQSNSRYGILVRDLQRVDMETLSETERLCFFLNLYNAMVIHAVITIGQPGLIDRRAFFTDFQYIVGGYPYSLSTIKNGILRSNRRQPYSFVKPFSSTDTRLKVPDLICQLVNFCWSLICSQFDETFLLFF